MAAAWFFLLAGMLTAYAVLDGWDLGVGAIYHWVARTEDERRICLGSVGPLWNGNEVWLIAAGGALFLSFPRVYAASFSGFYLALMLALWLLILRGVSLEIRNEIDNPLWTALWDAGFALGSGLLAVLLGVALGNLVRGLPLGPGGMFQGSFALLLNGYSVLVGILSVAVLSLHGAQFLRVKATGPAYDRARSLSQKLAPLVAVLVVAVSIMSTVDRPELLHNFVRWPVAFLLPILVVVSLAGVLIFSRGDRDGAAFAAGIGLIVALLTTAAVSVFPGLLHSTRAPEYSLSITNSASSSDSLFAGLVSIGPALVIVIAYQSLVYRIFWGRITADHLKGGHY